MCRHEQGKEKQRQQIEASEEAIPETGCRALHPKNKSMTEEQEPRTVFNEMHPAKAEEVIKQFEEWCEELPSQGLEPSLWDCAKAFCYVKPPQAVHALIVALFVSRANAVVKRLSKAIKNHNQ